MPLYRFEFREANGVSWGRELHDLASDGDAFAMAGALLLRQHSTDHVEVWQGERPVVSRHRYQPLIRPVEIRRQARRRT